MIYWGALMCVALITIFITFWKNTYYVVNWSLMDPIICHHPRPRVDHGADQGYSLRFTVVDAGWIEENGCINPCQHSSFELEPAIFRSYSDLQLMSREEVHAFGQIFSLPRYSFFTAYQYFATSLGMFLVSQGIWALCFGRRNPRQARDGKYSFTKSLSISVGPRSFKEKFGMNRPWKKRIAKYIAVVAYLWAVVASVLSVLLFVTNFIVLELLLTYFPQNEPATHIGAWSPWANTVLVILAAFISKFHAFLIRTICASVQRAIASLRYLRRDRPIHGDLLNDEHETKQLPQDTTRLPRTPIKDRAFFLRAVRILISCRDWMLSTRTNVKEEWDSFKAFWYDPENSLVFGAIHSGHCNIITASIPIEEEEISVPENCTLVTRANVLDPYAEQVGAQSSECAGP